MILINTGWTQIQMLGVWSRGSARRAIGRCCDVAVIASQRISKGQNCTLTAKQAAVTGRSGWQVTCAGMVAAPDASMADADQSAFDAHLTHVASVNFKGSA
jgi:hypothetical protein